MKNRQTQDEEWHRVRFGKITASQFNEVAKCKTDDGSLVEGMLGRVNFHPTERGIRLERQVRVKLREKYPNIEECRIFLKPKFPFFAASPDGITKD
jgi:hypothetical protein